MRISTIAVAAVAGLLVGAPVSAQTSSTTTTVTTSGPATTGSIMIAPEKRTVIRQQLTSAKPVMIKEDVKVGWTVPSSVELQTVPETVVSEVPAVKGHHYFVHENHVVLVDPQTRKVVTIIE